MRDGPRMLYSPPSAILPLIRRHPHGAALPPGDPEAHWLFAAVYQGLGKAHEAAMQARQALALWP